MTFEELLERLDDYFAGELPLEDVQRLEEQISRDPLLSMMAGLHFLEPLAGDQIADGVGHGMHATHPMTLLRQAYGI